MTHSPRGPDDYTDAEKRLMLDAFEDAPIDQARVRETVQLARQQLPFWRRTPVVGQVAAAVLVAALLGAVVWAWNGENSRDLSFARCVHVLRTPDEYEREKLLSAMNEAKALLIDMFRALHASDSVTPAFRASAAAALEAAPQQTIPYVGPFETLLVVATERQLTARELDQVLHAVRAAVAAIRSVEEREPTFARFSRIMRRRLRAALEGG